MKRAVNIIFFLFFLFSAGACFGQAINADSKIISVTVYPDSALISRSANLKLNPGEYKIVFPDIIPEVDENSLRVTSSTAEEIKLLGAQVKKEFLVEAAAERVKEIQAQIQTLNDQKKDLENTAALLAEDKQFLDSIRLYSGVQLPKELVTKTPSPKDLEETFKFLDTKLRWVFSQKLGTEIALRELHKKIEALNNELAQISGSARKFKRLITVDLQVLKSANFNLNITFLVRGASWHPIYDGRANFEKNEVELISHGIIQQKTGEDWQDVEVSLSTAKPSIGGRMPYVSPWFLKAFEYKATRSGAVGGRFDKLAKSPSASALQYEAFDLKSEMAGAPSEVEYAQPEEKGIAVVYKISHKATVKSDGSEHKLPVSTQALAAAFEYSTYPRISPSAFLGSRVTNAKELQLLSGRVNIFLDGDYVGASSIDNIGPGEEFDLYLGQDENVKVKREQLEKKMDDVLIAGIPSPTRKTTFKYKTTLENYKNKKIKLIFFEAMPISQDERIKVKIINTSLEPKEKDWKDRKGIWRFEVELAPKEKKEIIYSFSIEHPRDLQVEGL